MGRQEIERLTASWYLFILFSGALGFVMNGIGLFSAIFSVIGTGIGLGITYVIGKALIGKAGWLRALLVVLSGLGVVFGALGIYQLGAAFLSTWSFGLIGTMLLALGGIAMHVFSLRVLLGAPVRSYFS